MLFDVTLTSMTRDDKQITEMHTILREMNNTVRVLKWYILIMMATFFLILRLIVVESRYLRP